MFLFLVIAQASFAQYPTDFWDALPLSHRWRIDDLEVDSLGTLYFADGSSAFKAEAGSREFTSLIYSEAIDIHLSGNRVFISDGELGIVVMDESDGMLRHLEGLSVSTVTTHGESVYAGGSNGQLFYLKHEGASWTILNPTQLPISDDPIVDIVVTDDRIVYRHQPRESKPPQVATNIFVLEGEMWREANIGRLDGLLIHDDVYYSHRNDTIYTSLDGVTWSEFSIVRTDIQPVKEIHDLIITDEILLARQRNLSFYSFNNGLSWTLAGTSFRIFRPEHLTLGDDGYLYMTSREFKRFYRTWVPFLEAF